MRNLHPPVIESLESRALFSVSVGAIPPEPVVPISAVVSTPLSLNGTIKGTYKVSQKNPDTGANYSFKGTGSVGKLTAATLFGNVQLPGFIANGHASGKLTIYDKHGAVYLNVTGPTQTTSGTFPKTLSYTITGGTGLYHHDSGHGTISVTLTPAATAAASPTFTFVFKSA
jgi:hypothetical protein